MESPVTRLYLVRHGEVEESYHRIFGGRIDMNLSPRGQLQAASIAEYFEPFALDAVYCSPMKRAQQTMAPLLAAKAVEAVTMDGLREMDFGDWTGHRWEEIQEKFGVNAFSWIEQIENGLVPNAETGDLLRARIGPCVEEILAKHLQQTVAIFCHGGVIRVILSLLLRLPLPATAGFEVDYCSVSITDCRADRAILQLLNHAPWRALE